MNDVLLGKNIGPSVGPRPGSLPEREEIERRAFTLVELLVVIGIIALLIGILLPALSRANQSAKSLKCLSNLRQMSQAAVLYSNHNDGRYPIALYSFDEGPRVISYGWDYTQITIKVPLSKSVIPGLLWSKGTKMDIQQCPEFDGASNASALEPFTGYNYNKSYIGRGTGSNPITPERLSSVRSPSTCALFGDGQYDSGANKYMRSPKPTDSDTFAARWAGTQGYRHRKKTNVAFADGHAESLEKVYSGGFTVAPGTGFLSDDNSMYDLR